MYSLYRAWFGAENYSHLETLSPPDTLIRVGVQGEHQFVAHRGVLSAHSGHLKNLLSNTTNSSSNVTNNASGITSISLSSIGGEAFAPLLEYMYTGRLEVTSENIFNVLFATHLLHMPGALEQCRAALLRLEAPPPPPLPTTSTSRSATTVLRPVPNRLIGPPICWPQTGLYPTPSVGFSHLPLSSAIPVLENSRVAHENNNVNTTAFSLRTSLLAPSSPPLRCSAKTQKPKTKSSNPKGHLPSKSKEEKEESASRVHDSHEKKDQKNSSTSSPSGSTGGNSVTNLESTSSSYTQHNGRHSRESNDHASTSSTSGVVLDVACCDGPVMFERVINENYTVTPINGPTAVAQRSRGSRTETCTSSTAELTMDIGPENDENGRPMNADRRLENDESSAGSNGSHGNYTCEYCRHTFKSHYCYKKHARRHLLPASNNNNANDNGNTRGETKKRVTKLPDHNNVQYYPCKICGDRFPSYYFVHKHKKLVHAITDERSSESENSTQIADVAGCSSKT